MPDFLLPDLGEGLEEASVLTWLVGVGDVVAVDQVVVEVETAKAAVQVPIPFAGTISKLHAAAGANVRVGAPLITVSDADVAGFLEPSMVTPVPEPAADAQQNSGKVLIGFGTSATPGLRRRGRATRLRSQTAAVVGAGTAAAGATTVISPLVRKLARDAQLDLCSMVGSGPSGLIRRIDVEQAAQSTTAVSTLPTTTAGETRIPLSGVRRVAADKLSRSRREIPEATVWVDLDATDLLAARTALTASDPARPVSLLALLGRFTLLALRRYPVLNGRVDADEIVVPTAVGLGFAAQTDRGLVVPVIRDAHTLTTRDLTAALTKLAGAAKAGRLTPADLSGGTITINNYGVFGVDGSAAIINHPEVAIVGMGRIIDRPWVVDGQLAVRKIAQLTLAFDHRVCDGGTAGGFLRLIADCIESPVVALGDL